MKLNRKQIESRHLKMNILPDTPIPTTLNFDGFQESSLLTQQYINRYCQVLKNSRLKDSDQQQPVGRSKSWRQHSKPITIEETGESQNRLIQTISNMFENVETRNYGWNHC